MYFSIRLSALLLVLAPAILGQAATVGGRGTNTAGPVLPPMPPPPISFRQLLAMNPAERETLLATRSPAQRQILQQKLQEYESLPPTERAARLSCLQLRLYLRPLMEVPLSNRVERLAAVPQPDRKLVEDRLKFWDQLEPNIQKEFLKNEWVLRYILRPDTALASPGANVSSPVRNRIERGIEDWNQLPGSKRQEILENFKTIFEFSEKEKAKVLNEFSDAERRQMQKTLHTYERLPKGQRDRCVNGFKKFAELSLPERERFLSNAEVWKSMGSEERLAWRELVTRISIKPPFPPKIKAPPSPPSLRRPAQASSTDFTTNQ
jgi:hypothetical protein